MASTFKVTILTSLLMAMSQAGAYTLQDATRMAITQNPEVQAKLHTFNSAQEERSMTKGGLFPQLYASASAGHDTSNRETSDLSASRTGVGLTLSQLLFDGFRTQNELKKLSYAEWTRYYELLDTAENTALETTRAYYDVQRYREQVKQAEDNYVQHRAVYEQILQRVSSGVSRRVDLEQAAGRLALASSNLLTERSNLHDVSTRFQRIVGILPPEDMAEAPKLNSTYPKTVVDALNQAHQTNPALKAANANVAAAAAGLESSKNTNWPTIDLRASTRAGKNEDFIDGRRTDSKIEVVLNYNLFTGGTDSARTRMFNEQRFYAQDLRLKACRDMRQTVLIAYNDVQQLQQQLAYLDEHQLTTGKAREAYRQQFNIGQRTLLDLLDTENEYFEARRAATKGQYDLALAYSRTQAGTGQLLNALAISSPASKPSNETDPALNIECPAEGIAMPIDNKAELDARARDLLKSYTPAPTPAVVVPAPKPVIEVAKPTRIIEIKADGLFDLNRPELRPDGVKQIDDAVSKSGSSYAELSTIPGLTIKIVGHTDRTGSAKKNIKLSLARAQSTKAYLVSKGLKPEQMTTEGRGSSEPLTGKQCLKLKGAAKAACYGVDRRVELRVFELPK